MYFKLISGYSFQACQYLPSLRLDVHIVGVASDPLYLLQDVDVLGPEHDLVKAVVWELLCVKVLSDGRHVDVCQQSQTAEESVVLLASGDEVEAEAVRTLGCQQVRRVVLIAGEID